MEGKQNCFGRIKRCIASYTGRTDCRTATAPRSGWARPVRRPSRRPSSLSPTPLILCPYICQEKKEKQKNTYLYLQSNTFREMYCEVVTTQSKAAKQGSKESRLPYMLALLLTKNHLGKIKTSKPHVSVLFNQRLFVLQSNTIQQ